MVKKAAKATGVSAVKELRPRGTSKDSARKELPFYPVMIGDTTYKLCFDLDELDKAEEAFNREGHRVNMLFALDVGSMNLRSVKVLFAAAVRTFHPEIGYEKARSLVTIGSIFVVTTAILNAFADAKDKEFAQLPAKDKAAIAEVVTNGDEPAAESNDGAEAIALGVREGQ